ncbi:hypothetical protein [Micromonospora sp. CB01531]|uniref:hypothetical protein n=1 Tax=Micromonospora sp. CB01531 TaxID=1718947 RepID=UPI00093AD209|nr:hypothetical protein [Micromonospora sp. CB01531]OKI47283.1 hypothetical protein A6A27_10575 [Micromonospora sp. CB01531]
MSHTPPAPRRQPAYDAVYAVIRQYPPITSGDIMPAVENGRVWRAVHAALDAVEPAAHLLPLLDLTADELDALRLAAAKYRAIDTKVPALNSALDKLTTTDTTEETS